MALHEGFGKGLGTLQLGRRFGWAKNTQTMAAELVHHTFGQRAFGSHHSQPDLFGHSPFPQSSDARDLNVLKAMIQRGAPIARSHKNRLYFG